MRVLAILVLMFTLPQLTFAEEFTTTWGRMKQFFAEESTIPVLQLGPGVSADVAGQAAATVDQSDPLGIRVVSSVRVAGVEDDGTYLLWVEAVRGNGEPGYYLTDGAGRVRAASAVTADYSRIYHPLSGRTLWKARTADPLAELGEIAYVYTVGPTARAIHSFLCTALSGSVSTICVSSLVPGNIPGTIACILTAIAILFLCDALPDIMEGTINGDPGSDSPGPAPPPGYKPGESR